MIHLGRTTKKRALLLGCALFCVLATYGLAIAGGHGGGHDDARTVDLIYRFINFALLVIILVVVLKKTNAFGFLAKRREEIRQEMEDLKRRKEAAERRYKELEQKFKEFEVQRAQILEQYKAEGLAEKEKIIAEAKERARQILAQADRTIEREILEAGARLKRQVVEAAAERAREIISAKLDDNDQDNLIKDFIERVEKLH
ncbi:MAG: ATP synthase F0 subunit B [Deltaproteobacteria bacterium]|nr:ATP synthase F0 subunit B [Deltaproteobacteria bacterium]RLB40585.1 MAG: hypothetical protein DRH20_01075 [Deltaproteobacteria bacterium]